MGQRRRGATARRTALYAGALCALVACESPDERTHSLLSAGAPAGSGGERTEFSAGAGGGPELSAGNGGKPELSAGAGGGPELSAGNGGKPEPSAGGGGVPAVLAGAGGKPELSAGAGGKPELSAGAAGAETTISISYRRDIQPIWDEYCTSCHGFQSPKLEAPGSRSSLDGASRFPECSNTSFLVPGEPEKSFLYFKLTRRTDVPMDPACERWMPAAWAGMRDVPLIEIDPDAVARVRQWILEGARAD